MTFLLPVTIDGANYEAHAEYTSNAVGKAYEEWLASFAEVFNLGLDDGNDSDAVRSEIEDGDYHTKMEKAVEELLKLAKDGMTDPNDPVDTNRKHYLSVEMAASLSQLIKTLRAAGAEINAEAGTATITTDNVVMWKSLAVNSDAIRQVVSFAIDTAVDQNRTLQALVELIYVKTGNKILTENLNDLEAALSTTNDALKTLTQLQELHNRIESTQVTESFEDYAGTIYSDGVNERGSVFVEGSYNDSGELIVTGVAGQASEYFRELQPTVDLNDLTGSDTSLFLELRNDIAQQISILTATTPGAGTPSDSGSLLDKLRTVKEHMDAAISEAGDLEDPDTAKKALRFWILDNQNNDALIGGIDQGQIQRELTAAISAGQSLNDSQKEEVRRYLFVFEEYYKSASAVLNKITQILERMAQGIAR